MNCGSETLCKIYLIHCTYSQQITSTAYCSAVQKKKHSLKVEKSVLFGRFEDLGPEESISGSSEGLLRRGEG